ncbi:hypothetical protein J3E68DRAFT_427966 [Trichoderma sp. SZMC 28012]
MLFPSQPLTFFGADGQEKYRKLYFERFGNEFWWQGDYIQRVQPTGRFVILGRSDGVLNPSGVRFGSAEIYTVTETFPDISDSICVGQRRSIDEDESVLLFVLMKAERELTDALKAKLKSSISNKYSIRHVPRYIFEVKDIPYTVNGKKCKINVKHIVSGRDVTFTGTCMGSPHGSHSGGLQAEPHPSRTIVLVEVATLEGDFMSLDPEDMTPIENVPAQVLAEEDCCMEGVAAWQKDRLSGAVDSHVLTDLESLDSLRMIVTYLIYRPVLLITFDPLMPLKTLTKSLALFTLSNGKATKYVMMYTDPEGFAQSH